MVSWTIEDVPEMSSQQSFDAAMGEIPAQFDHNRALASHGRRRGGWAASGHTAGRGEGGGR